MSAGTSRRHPPELKERAVRMFTEVRNDHESRRAAMNAVADLLGVGSGETADLSDGLSVASGVGAVVGPGHIRHFRSAGCRDDPICDGPICDGPKDVA